MFLIVSIWLVVTSVSTESGMMAIALGACVWAKPSVTTTFLSESMIYLHQGAMMGLASGVMLGLLVVTWITCKAAIFSMSPVNSAFLSSLLSTLVLVCGVFFSSSSWLLFYITFELSLLPIFLIIMGWGYQTERTMAAKAMFFYTVMGSMPLLSALIAIMNESTFFLGQTQGGGLGGPLVSVLSLCSLAFLVKLPLFLTHMWLPKAHVEAPVIGSMYLAAVLLKLGGFGLLKISLLLSQESWFMNWILGVALWGLVVVPWACSQAIDMKVMIALSSVAHMSVAVLLILVSNVSSINWSVLILLSHGLSSSMAFFQSFLVYKTTNTRSILLSKKLKGAQGLFSLMWVVMGLAVLGAPPTMNLWVEISAFLLSVTMIHSSMKILFWAALLTGVYCFILLSYPYSGNVKVFMKLLGTESVSMVLLVYFSLSVVLMSGALVFTS